MVGKKIKILREKNSMPVEFVASQLNIPIQKVLQLEQGTILPTRQELIEFADLFGIATDSFFFDDLKDMDLTKCF